MKTCFKCQQTKELSEFYPHKQMADGYLGKCKECTRTDAKKHRDKDIEVSRAKDRARGTRVKPGYLKQYRERFPKKYKAVCAVNNAVRDKKLLKLPCNVCGDLDVHAHHCDYDKPLEILWLCPIHHKQWHMENGEALNPF